MVDGLILIIDGSEYTRAMYSEYFRYHGYSVAEAGNATEGLHLARQLKPDLIVTELSDEPAWLWSIRRIRDGRAGHRPWIIACSTIIDASCPFGPPGVDVDLALAKPISPRALLLQMQLLLQSSRMEATALSA
jgi:DNA-binding response OmpR family regulator